MTEIIAAPLTRFRKQQHLALMTNLDVLVVANPKVKDGLGDLYSPFKTLLAQEIAAVEMEQGSLVTKKMEDKDEEREDYITGFNHLLENGLRHFDPTKREAAQTLKHMSSKYGVFSQKTNSDETVDIRAMCTECQSPAFSTYLSALPEAPDWVSHIQLSNEEYDALYRQRNAENNGQVVTTSLQVRALIDPCYQAIVRRVTSLIDLKGEADYAGFVNQLNGFITDLKNTMSVQAAARKKSNDTKTDTETK